MFRILTPLALGIFVGATGGWLLGSGPPRAAALAITHGSGDRHDDYVICTGMSGVNPRSPLDGIWLLDYKQGKLLATIVDRSVGKVTGFAEMDLVSEFGFTANQNVHFLMTTGTITAGQSALYLVETTTGKFGVYTLGPSTTGASGVAILRHDLTNFRKPNS